MIELEYSIFFKYMKMNNFIKLRKIYKKNTNFEYISKNSRVIKFLKTVKLIN